MGFEKIEKSMCSESEEIGSMKKTTFINSCANYLMKESKAEALESPVVLEDVRFNVYDRMHSCRTVKIGSTVKQNLKNEFQQEQFNEKLQKALNDQKKADYAAAIIYGKKKQLEQIAEKLQFAQSLQDVDNELQQLKAISSEISQLDIAGRHELARAANDIKQKAKELASPLEKTLPKEKELRDDNKNLKDQLQQISEALMVAYGSAAETQLPVVDELLAELGKLKGEIAAHQDAIAHHSPLISDSDLDKTLAENFSTILKWAKEQKRMLNEAVQVNKIAPEIKLISAELQQRLDENPKTLDEQQAAFEDLSSRKARLEALMKRIPEGEQGNELRVKSQWILSRLKDLLSQLGAKVDDKLAALAAFNTARRDVEDNLLAITSRSETDKTAEEVIEQLKKDEEALAKLRQSVADTDRAALDDPQAAEYDDLIARLQKAEELLKQRRAAAEDELEKQKATDDLHKKTVPAQSRLAKLIEEADNLLNDPEGVPSQYQPLSDDLRREIAIAQDIINAGAPADDETVRSLQDAIITADKEASILWDRAANWEYFITVRNETDAELERLRQPLEDVLNKSDRQRDISEVEKDLHDLTAAKNTSDILADKIRNLQRLSEFLHPLESAYADVRFYDIDAERTEKQYDDLLNDLAAEIDDDKVLHDSANHVKNELMALQQLLVQPLSKDSIANIEQHQLPALKAQVEMLKDRNREESRKHLAPDSNLLTGVPEALEHLDALLAEAKLNADRLEKDELLMILTLKLTQLEKTPLEQLSDSEIVKLDNELEQAETAAADELRQKLHTLRKAKQDQENALEEAKKQLEAIEKDIASLSEIPAAAAGKKAGKKDKKKKQPADQQQEPTDIATLEDRLHRANELSVRLLAVTPIPDTARVDEARQKIDEIADKTKQDLEKKKTEEAERNAATAALDDLQKTLDETESSILAADYSAQKLADLRKDAIPAIAAKLEITMAVPADLEERKNALTKKVKHLNETLDEKLQKALDDQKKADHAAAVLDEKKKQLNQIAEKLKSAQPLQDVDNELQQLKAISSEISQLDIAGRHELARAANDIKQKAKELASPLEKTLPKEKELRDDNKNLKDQLQQISEALMVAYGSAAETQLPVVDELLAELGKLEDAIAAHQDAIAHHSPLISDSDLDKTLAENLPTILKRAEEQKRMLNEAIQVNTIALEIKLISAELQQRPDEIPENLDEQQAALEDLDARKARLEALMKRIPEGEQGNELREKSQWDLSRLKDLLSQLGAKVGDKLAALAAFNTARRDAEGNLLAITSRSETDKTAEEVIEQLKKDEEALAKLRQSVADTDRAALDDPQAVEYDDLIARLQKAEELLKQRRAAAEIGPTNDIKEQTFKTYRPNPKTMPFPTLPKKESKSCSSNNCPSISIKNKNDTNAYNIILLGEASVGKTTLLSSIANYLQCSSEAEVRKSPMFLSDQSFYTTVNSESHNISVRRNYPPGEKKNVSSEYNQSQYPFMQEVPFFDTDGTRKTLRILDTPGNKETNMKDALDNILSAAKQMRTIHGICILLRPKQGKIQGQYRQMLNNILNRLHKDSIRNICFVFTQVRAPVLAPGDGLPLIGNYLKESKIDLKADLSNTFRFDNGWFRNVCIAEHNKTSGTNYSSDWQTDGWSHSQKEMERLMAHLEELEPYQMEKSVFLDEINQLLSDLAEPVSKALYKRIVRKYEIEKTIGELTKHLKEAKTAQALTKPKLFGRIVCMSLKCNNSICFENANFDLYGAENKNKRCQKCACYNSAHCQTKSPVVAENEKPQDISEIIKDIQSETEKLMNEEKETEDNFYKIVNICSQLAVYLNTNTIVAGIDPFFDYFNSLCQIEKEREKHFGTSYYLKYLQSVCDRYIEDSNPKSKPNPQRPDIEEIKKYLENNKYYGEFFKVLRLPDCDSVNFDYIDDFEATFQINDKLVLLDALPNPEHRKKARATIRQMAELRKIDLDNKMQTEKKKTHKELLDSLENEINIILLGQSGVGKSTFINAFFNFLSYISFEEAKNKGVKALISSHFKDDDKTINVIGRQDNNENLVMGKSSTVDVRVYEFKWHSKNIKKVIRIIDTPGLADTGGIAQDQQNLDNIFKGLSGFSKIHGVCVLVKAANSRKTHQFCYILNELFCHLSPSALKNIVFCCTNSRATNFTPGDTFVTLTNYLADKKIAIPLDTSHVFSIDNEWFRYLWILKSNEEVKEKNPKVSLTRDEHRTQEINVGSWNESFSAYFRLLTEINKVQPMETAPILRLANVRKCFNEVCKRISLAEDEKRQAKSVINDHNQQVAHLTSEIENINKISTQVITEKVGVNYRNTICTKCTEKNDIAEPCHENCTCVEAMTEVADNADIQKCTVMKEGEPIEKIQPVSSLRNLSEGTTVQNIDINCEKCSCSWALHMQVTYKMEKQYKIVLSQPNKKITAEMQKKRKASEKEISEHNAKIGRLTKELKYLEEKANDLARYIKTYAALTVNKSILEYLSQTEFVNSQESGKNTRELADLKKTFGNQEKIIERVEGEAKSPAEMDNLMNELKRTLDSPKLVILLRPYKLLKVGSNIPKIPLDLMNGWIGTV